MTIEIISPEKQVYEGLAHQIQFPGVDGLFGVLKDHAPLISALGKGEIVIEDGKENPKFPINGGVVEINRNKIIVLVD